MLFGLPNPTFLIKIGAGIIGTEAQLILTGRRVVSKSLEEKNFHFEYPKLESALHDFLE